MRFPTPLGLALSAVVLLSAGQAQAVCSWAGLEVGTEVAELETSMGTICIELLRDDAPGHVDNFLYYLQNGRYRLAQGVSRTHEFWFDFAPSDDDPSAI